MFGNDNLRLIPKRSTISGKVPSTLDHLELCLNLADGLVWIGDCIKANKAYACNGLLYAYFSLRLCIKVRTVKVAVAAPLA